MSADAARALGSAPSPSSFVLAGRPLLPGTQLADTSRFSDDVWRMKPAILQVQERTVGFDFLTLPQRFRPATRRPRRMTDSSPSNWSRRGGCWTFRYTTTSSSAEVVT